MRRSNGSGRSVNATCCESIRRALLAPSRGRRHVQLQSHEAISHALRRPRWHPEDWDRARAVCPPDHGLPLPRGSSTIPARYRVVTVVQRRPPPANQPTAARLERLIHGICAEHCTSQTVVVVGVHKRRIRHRFGSGYHLRARQTLVLELMCVKTTRDHRALGHRPCVALSPTAISSYRCRRWPRLGWHPPHEPGKVRYAHGFFPVLTPRIRPDPRRPR